MTAFKAAKDLAPKLRLVDAADLPEAPLVNCTLKTS
jgi:hypothetical protein